MGENHTTFWAFNNMKYEIEDKEKDMTKETLLELIDKFINICENNITTGIHKKLSEENMFNFIDESDLKIKEIYCCKIEEDDVSNVYLLEKNKSFLIHGNYYFNIYDSNTFKRLQGSITSDRISYINIIDSKRFLISFKKSYKLYKFEDNKYKWTKIIDLQEVNLEEFKKEMGIVTKSKDKKKQKKKKNNSSDSEDNENNKNKKGDKSDKDEDSDKVNKSDNDSDNDSDSNEYKEGEINPKDINSNISAITLLKDETKIACGQGSLISIREYETGKLIKTLASHEGGIDVLFICKNYLVSCCSCNNLCFWDLNNFNLIKKLDAEISSPTSYLIIDDNLITGGSMIGYKINLNDLEVEGTFSGNFMLMHAFVQINDFEILIATKDYSTSSNNFYLLNLYDIDDDDTDVNLYMNNIHSDICEGCIKIDDKRFISVSRDCIFKVWNIKDEEKQD